MRLLRPFLRWFRRSAPAPIVSPYSGGATLDAYRRHRAPSAHELLAELKGAAWTCAAINAAVCAAHPPRLFVSTAPEQPRPRCAVRSAEPALLRRLAADGRAAPNAAVEEVVDHPLLTLLRQVNPVHNAFHLLKRSGPIIQQYLE